MTTDERRGTARTRTRLRPGKLLGEDGRFLADCAILDRNAGGVRIRLFAQSQDLPCSLTLFDEADALRWQAVLVWSDGALAGLRFAAAAESVDPLDAERIAGRYYAVRRDTPVNWEWKIPDDGRMHPSEEAEEPGRALT